MGLRLGHTPALLTPLWLALTACAGITPSPSLGRFGDPPPGIGGLTGARASAEQPAPARPPATPVPLEEAQRTLPEPLEEDAEAAPPPEPELPCPVEMVLLDSGSCINRWEASLVEMVGGLEQPWSPYRSPAEAAGELRALSAEGVVPQAYVSGIEAAAACAVAGKRLCGANEWEAACRGPSWTLYPYGNARKKHMCNDDGRKLHPVVEVHRTLGLPVDRMWYEGMEHPLINQLDKTLLKTGLRSECTNEYGVFDMVGNLHEWIDDPEGTFRGGFYMDTQINGEGCDYATTAHSTGYHDYSTGFRCCRDATVIPPGEPAAEEP